MLGKMEILNIHNNELTTKLENIDSTPGASLVEMPEIIKKHASTSCFDLIDDSNPCNQGLVKNVVIETCSYEIAIENEQLKQEVARLGNVLYDKKGRAKQIQHPNDNTTAEVNKPVERETVICRLCHKSYQCKAKTGDKQKQMLKQNPTSKISSTYINKVDKKGCYTIFNQEEKEWKGDSNQGQQASQQRKGGQTHQGAKGDYLNHEKCWNCAEEATCGRLAL
jgi:hypothetical protein